MKINFRKDSKHYLNTRQHQQQQKQFNNERKQQQQQQSQQQPKQQLPQSQNSQTRVRMNSSASSSRRSNSSTSTRKPKAKQQQPQQTQNEQQHQPKQTQNSHQKQRKATRNQRNQQPKQAQQPKEDGKHTNEHTSADQILLNLLKINNSKTTNENQQSSQKQSNIFDKLLNTSPTSSSKSNTLVEQNNYILSLMNQNKSPNKMNFLAAHELEEQQLATKKNASETNILEKLLFKQQQLNLKNQLFRNNKDVLVEKTPLTRTSESVTKFPTITPQENPFQNMLNLNHESQLSQTINSALNQILKSSSSSSASSTAPSSSSASANSSPSKQEQQQSIENIFNKLKLSGGGSQQQPAVTVPETKEYTSNEIKEYFNNLMFPQQQSSILKWFSLPQQQLPQRTGDFEVIKQNLKLPENVPVLSLKDIENY